MTLACALSRIKDIAVNVYEQAADFNNEIGAGLSVGHRNVPLLSSLGLTDDIAAIAGKPKAGMEGR